MVLQLIRQNDQAVVVRNGKVADQFFSRLKGLIGTKEFHEGEGLLFPKCNNVHMWMMSIPIDVVFLKENGKNTWEIVKIYNAVKPWRPLPVYSFKAQDALELPSGTAARLSLKAGEVLCFAS